MNANSVDVVVTRHKGLVEYLRRQGVIDEHTPVIAHATTEDVAGKSVIGVLPLWLASHALTVTEVPMNIPADMRGVELTAEQVAEYAGEPRTYSVRLLSS